MDYTVFELDEAVVGVDVNVKVLQHDELPALVTLLSPTPAVILVLHQAAHLHVSRTELAEGRPLETLTLLNTECQLTVF